jgi:hypothetical protein
MSRLSSLRRNVPKDISESVVNEYHAIVDELEPGCGNLAGFRIKDTEVKPKIIPMPFYVCQGRSKTRPVRRSKSRPVDSGVVVVRYAG